MPLQPSSSSIPLNKIRVLLAEAHPLIRKTFAELLSEAPEIQEVSEVNQLSADRVKQLKPHVLILNGQIPNAKDLLTSESWRKRYPNVHILMLSERGHQDTPGTDEWSSHPVHRSVRLVAGREESLSRRVVDILVKSLNAYEYNPQMNLSAKEIWV